MDCVDAVAVGAGVVGLAVAHALARRGLDTLVLEREHAAGTGTSAQQRGRACRAVSPDGALQPAYSGVRPKLADPCGSSSGFVLQGPTDHGITGPMNLFGIESPGLTASLAIAGEGVARLGV